jgi:striatin 1/3/4
MERSDDVLISGQTSTSIYNNNGSINNIQNGDINAVLNNSTAQTSNVSNGPTNTNDKQSNSSSNNNNAYTMPGILHYLQHEWNRFEFERQQWEVDRAELMTKISFLQGERRGQENLKINLIRRIKMLELALKQERIKYHKLKYGVEPQSITANDLKNATATSLATNDINNDLINDIENNTFSISHHPILNKENNTSATKQGRELLKQYLQEIGYTDTIVDVRSSRLRALLGLKATNNNVANLTNDQLDIFNLINNNNSSQLDSISSLVNGNKQLLQLSNTKKIDSAIIQNQSNHTNGNLNNSEVQKILKMSESDAQSMLMMANLDFSNSNNNNSNIEPSKALTNKPDYNLNNMDDEDLDEESRSKSNNDQVSDLDTEDALKEFSFLSNESTDDGTTSTMWANVDKVQINRMTEQYKKDRKTAKQQHQQALASHQVTQRPNRATLQAMIANLSDSDNGNNDSTILSGSSPTSSNKLNNFSFPNNTKLFLDEEGSFSNDTNLGELSRISVNNTINIGGLNDETVIDATTQRKTITSKFALRGHFDAVRCLAFHPTDSVLITGSEDQTIKLWNLDKSSLSNKKNVNSDIEPIYTFRSHTKAVLSVLISSNGDYCISAGLDSKIIVWNMPNYEATDQYDSYSPNVFLKYLNGHTDAVWSLALADNTLASVSADSTIRIWNPFNIDELSETGYCLSCLNENKNEGTPSSLDFINNDKSRLITSFGVTHHNLYDIETSKIISRFDYFDSTSNTHCYKVLSHPSNSTTNSSLILSAHEDKKIRFFDVNSGKMVYQMVAHQDACTDLAIDPTCFYLLSASHDCSIRLWNIDNKNCIQEMTSHRKKYDESIHCIAFHPTKSYIASGGADAIVKIYV